MDEEQVLKLIQDSFNRYLAVQAAITILNNRDIVSDSSVIKYVNKFLHQVVAEGCK